MSVFTARQTERQDFVDNAIHTLIEELLGMPAEWDIQVIAAVRQVIQQYLWEEYAYPEREFYPYRELEG